METDASLTNRGDFIFPNREENEIAAGPLVTVSAARPRRLTRLQKERFVAERAQMEAEGTGLRIAYLRVSTVDQGDKFGLKAQQRDIDFWCVSRGGGRPVDRVFLDKFSGYSETREGIEELRKLLDTGQVYEVIFADIGRLARDRVASENLYREFRQKAGKAISATEDFGSGIEGDLFRGIKQALWEYEGRKIVQKMNKGRIAGIEDEGIWPGGWGVYGFRPVGKGQLAKVEDEAANVVTVFELSAQGHSRGETAREMNRRGLKTMMGRAWDAQAVQKVIDKREFYAGRSTIWQHLQSEQVQHEAILSPELEARLDAALAPPEGMITGPEAARRKGVDESTLNGWRRKGQVSAVGKQQGSRILYYYWAAELDAITSGRGKRKVVVVPETAARFAEATREKQVAVEARGASEGAICPPDGRVTVAGAACLLALSEGMVRRYVEQGELGETQTWRPAGQKPCWTLDEATVRAFRAKLDGERPAPLTEGACPMAPALAALEKKYAKGRKNKAGAVDTKAVAGDTVNEERPQ